MSILSEELDNDMTTGLQRGYAGMTDREAADDLNIKYRERIKDRMSGDEIFQQTDAAEFGGLTDAKKAQWLAFCARDEIDPSAVANVAFVEYVFGNPSTTRTTLIAARMEPISRAVEIIGKVVGEADIWDARNI